MKLSTFVDYFEGYTEAKIPKKNGKGYKIIRIYTGNYHVQNVSDRQWILKKFAYAVLIIAAVFFFLAASLNRNPGNSTVFVALFSGFSAFSLIFASVSCINYICSSRKMTVFMWKKSSGGIKRWCFASACCLFCTAVTSFIYMLFFFRDIFFMGLLYSIVYCLGGLCAFAINKIETMTEYFEEFNNVQTPFYQEGNFL